MEEQIYTLFSVVLGLNTGLCICKAGALLLEPYLQSILLWLYWRWGSQEQFAWAGLEIPFRSQTPK
jgi:hypothetical protein